MVSKRIHRRELPVSKYLKKAAVAGGAAATAAAMTMTLAAPAGALSAPAASAASQTADVDGALVRLTASEILGLGPLLDLLGDGAGLDELLSLAALTDLLGGDGLGDLLGGDGLGDLLGGGLLDGLLGGGLLDGLFGLGGPDLTEPLELLGINVVSTGPLFGALALLGINLGWVAALPSLIEDEVTSTESPLQLGALIGQLLPGLDEILGGLGFPVTNGVRIPIVLGWGLGSLAAGMAYPNIAEYFTSDEQRDALTILPMLLLRNWGRADGGIAARFAPLLDPIAQVFGYDSVVTPDVETDVDTFNVLGLLDIPVGGLLPVKIDATWEYDTFSDFPAWPNPVSLLNAAAALFFPTYILRGGDLDILDDLTGVLTGALLDGLLDPEADLNFFLTIGSDRQPILEPFRYPFDIANLFTGGAFNFTNPVADAIEPAIKILGNLGFTNVVQNPALGSGLDPYDRDFSDNYGQTPTPFMTLPDNIDWGQVVVDVVEALVQGFTESFLFGGIPGVNNPYVNNLPGVDGITSGTYRSPFDLFGDVFGAIGNLPDLLPDLLGGLVPGLGASTSGARLASPLALDVNGLGLAPSGLSTDLPMFQLADGASFRALTGITDFNLGDSANRSTFLDLFAGAAPVTGSGAFLGLIGDGGLLIGNGIDGRSAGVQADGTFVADASAGGRGGLLWGNGGQGGNGLNAGFYDHDNDPQTPDVWLDANDGARGGDAGLFGNGGMGGQGGNAVVANNQRTAANWQATAAHGGAGGSGGTLWGNGGQGGNGGEARMTGGTTNQQPGEAAGGNGGQGGQSGALGTAGDGGNGGNAQIDSQGFFPSDNPGSVATAGDGGVGGGGTLAGSGGNGGTGGDATNNGRGSANGGNGANSGDGGLITGGGGDGGDGGDARLSPPIASHGSSTATGGNGGNGGDGGPVFSTGGDGGDSGKTSRGLGGATTEGAAGSGGSGGVGGTDGQSGSGAASASADD